MPMGEWANWTYDAVAKPHLKSLRKDMMELHSGLYTPGHNW